MGQPLKKLGNQEGKIIFTLGSKAEAKDYDNSQNSLRWMLTSVDNKGCWNSVEAESLWAEASWRKGLQSYWALEYTAPTPNPPFPHPGEGTTFSYPLQAHGKKILVNEY